MTAAASVGTRYDPMDFCEDEDNSVSEKIQKTGRESEVEAIRADAVMPVEGLEGVLENGIEEDEGQEYRRKKEHLLKRVESEQLADEERITELEGRDQALEQDPKHVGRRAEVINEEREQLGKELQSLAARQARQQEYLRLLKKRQAEG